MPYSLTWMIDKRVMVYTPQGNFTFQDTKEANAAVRQFVTEGENPVHSITDLSKLEKFPTDINMLKADYPYHDATGSHVFMGGNAIMKYLANIIGVILSEDIHVAKTMDEAIALLKEKDPTLQFDE